MSAYTFFLFTVCLASFIGAAGGVLFVRLVTGEKRTVQSAMQEYFDRKEMELNQMISRTNIPKKEIPSRIQSRRRFMGRWFG